VLGYQYRDWQHVRHALCTSCIGMGMLSLPLLPLVFERLGTAVWVILWGSALVSRVRYSLIAQQGTAQHAYPSYLGAVMLVLLCDWLAWAQVLRDLIHWRQQW
jgi:hypothetical protein